MPNRITRHSASAALEMLPDGVLVVRLTGPLTGDALQHFKAEIVARHGPQIRAFVADYTAAMVALSGPDLDAVLEGENPGSAPSMPAAMVVRAEVADTFGQHAARMALHGIRRRVFLEAEPALSWARRRAARSPNP